MVYNRNNGLYLEAISIFISDDCLGELRRVRTPIYSHCDSVEIHTDTSTPTPGVADCSRLPGIVPGLVRVQENPSVPGE